MPGIVALVPASKPASAAPAIKAFLFFVIVLSKLLFEFVTCYMSPRLKFNRRVARMPVTVYLLQDRKSFASGRPGNQLRERI